jgi:hypothetical protein
MGGEPGKSQGSGLGVGETGLGVGDSGLGVREQASPGKAGGFTMLAPQRGWERRETPHPASYLGHLLPSEKVGITGRARAGIKARRSAPGKSLPSPGCQHRLKREPKPSPFRGPAFDGLIGGDAVKTL